MKLEPHQLAPLEKLVSGSVLCGDVGSGKTHVSLAWYVQKACEGDIERDEPMKNPMNLVVITTAKKRDDLDWEETALDFGIFRDPENSYGGVSITVDSWNNAAKYQDLENTAFIFDEQKAVGSGPWAKAFIKIAKNKTNKWIMLSATPGDNWIDYVPLFLAHGFFRNRTDFIEQHVIWTFHGKFRKIRGYYGKRHLERYRSSILVEMPFERHTTRHLIQVPVDHDTEAFNLVWKKLWNPFDDVPLIDVSEKHRLGRKVVNSAEERLEAIEKISESHPRLIIFYNFDYELEMLRTLMTKLDIPVAEWNGHRHEPVPDLDRWLYLVQYTAGAEGWNCTTTDAMVFYSLNYSNKVFSQAQGRIDRMNTPYFDLYYYILMSKAKIDQLIWQALTTKKNFHEGRNVKYEAA